jgi:hypothetical protein
MSVRYGIILWGGDNESYQIFKLKKVIRIISYVSNHTSCRQIFKYYNKLTPSSLCIIEVICFGKRHLDLHNHNM